MLRLASNFRLASSFRLASNTPKLVRYAAVSAVTVPLTQVLLLVFYSVVGLSGMVANALAVSVAAGPGYVLNRSWVWRKNDPHSLSREVLPFWGLNLVGLVLSSLAVGWADSQTNNAVLLMAVSIGTFGLIWLAKFSTLDRWLFVQPGSPTPEHREARASKAG